MFGELYAPLPDRNEYLTRIKMQPPKNIDEAYLDQLIYSHQCYIPFENLDIFEFQKPIDLGIEKVFQKVIHQKRGGYCFELNSLCYMLLKELGYDAYPCAARIVRGKDFTPPILHRGILIRMEGSLLFCDVGYGGPMPAGALLVEDGYEKTCSGQRFRIDCADEYWWTVSYISKGGAEKILQFTTMPQEPVDYIAPNEYCSRNESSVFLNKRLLNLRTKNGSRSIVDDTFTEISNHVRTEKKIQTREDLNQILKQYFGIIL